MDSKIMEDLKKEVFERGVEDWFKKEAVPQLSKIAEKINKMQPDERNVIYGLLLWFIHRHIFVTDSTRIAMYEVLKDDAIIEYRGMR